MKFEVKVGKPFEGVSDIQDANIPATRRTFLAELRLTVIVVTMIVLVSAIYIRNPERFEGVLFGFTEDWLNISNESPNVSVSEEENQVCSSRPAGSDAGSL